MAETANGTPRWNVKRGLNRLFAALSLCWYIAVGIFLWSLRQQQPPQLQPGEEVFSMDEIRPDVQGKFDVDGARKEGYGDDEILDHLASSRKFDVQHAIRDGYSKQEIINHLASIRKKEIPPPPPGFVPEVAEARSPRLASTPIPSSPLRPIGLTVALLLMPPAVYGIAIAFLWIGKGFRSVP
jgi:hypothetical protein